ncbi:hypothetical protein KW459_15710 [Vibrio fluvialis]|nr:hypothetical protein [Vibrio fluvialis]
MFSNHSLSNITDDEVTAFVKAHYKHDRLFGRTAANGWDDDYGTRIVQNYVNTLRDLSLPLAFQMISRHESVTGESISFDRKSVIQWTYQRMTPNQLKEQMDVIQAIREPHIRGTAKYANDVTRRQWAILSMRARVIAMLLHTGETLAPDTVVA